MFRFAPCVKFEPWVTGSSFNAEFPRILLVGESHFASLSQADDRKLTRKVVTDARNGKLDPKSGKRFFTNVEALVVGELLTQIRKKEWWTHVAFYNYIQAPVGDKSRTYLDVSRFKEAHEAFHNVLSVLQPDLVIILGTRIWRRIVRS